jgi:pimeloyl-ACP methyl ester carboxylesterase
MAYYTFATGEHQNLENEDLHPILFLHGFPSSGVEGACCARMAGNFGCRLYGIDRPGFGSSDPPAAPMLSLSPDEYICCFVDQIFDFVLAKKWKEFSVMGVSGGGLYALAVLERYLTLAYPQENQSAIPEASVPKLTAVALVAGVCCAGGTEGMNHAKKVLFQLSRKTIM